MNALVITMMSGLLMGSIVATVNGTAYPVNPYQNPLVYVSGMMNRESSVMDANKTGSERDSVMKANKESSLIANTDFLKEEALFKKKMSVVTLNKLQEIFRVVGIYA